MSYNLFELIKGQIVSGVEENKTAYQILYILFILLILKY